MFRATSAMLYEDLFRQLAKDRVAYVAIGGVVRRIAGLDLSLEMSEKNLKCFIDATTAQDTRPKCPSALRLSAIPDDATM